MPTQAHGWMYRVRALSVALLITAGCDWEVSEPKTVDQQLQGGGSDAIPADDGSDDVVGGDAVIGNPDGDDSCGDDVAADSSGDDEPADDCVNPKGLTGYPTCGKLFAAQVNGYCTSCGDPDCTSQNTDRSVCTCFASGARCWTEVDPDGGVAEERCSYVGESCECDDSLGNSTGKGPIYTCECEGGGDQCECRVPEEIPAGFDYELDCEHTNG